MFVSDLPSIENHDLRSRANTYLLGFPSRLHPLCGLGKTCVPPRLPGADSPCPVLISHTESLACSEGCSG